MQEDLNLNKKILTFEKVSKVYPGSKETALRSINFSVYDGEFVCLIGPSGEGKTTVLKIIAGLEAPTTGTIVRPAVVSMVFQSTALFPWLSVFDNVAIGLRALNIVEKEVRKIATEFIEMMGLSEYKEKYPRDLSGGQKQRVGIARALAVNPHVLLLDEPFSALDAKTTAELHDDLLKIWKEHRKTIVMVSHLIEEAVSLAERVILIKNNSISDIFKIDLSYPRREQGTKFLEEVNKIRKEFFK